MHRGFTKAYRREIDEPSQVWLMPPIYHRIFYYLRQRAAWETRLIPNKGALGTWLAPGSIITSVDKIVEAVSYYDKGDLRTPAKRTILDVLIWLEDQAMITRLSNTRGTLIYINNWHIYQSDYRTDYRGEHHSQHHSEHRSDYLYKEVIEVKELLRSLNILPGGGNTGDIKPGKNGDGPPGIDHAAEFKSIWALYPLKDGSAKAKRIFTATVKTLGDLQDINKALDNYLAHLKRHPRKKIKNGSTWFEGWGDWINWIEPETPEQRKKKTDILNKKRSNLIKANEDIKCFKDRIEWKSPGHEQATRLLPKAEAAKARLEVEIEDLEALTQGTA